MPDADTRRRLRVACTDERGRSIRGAGLARWLERTAPARVRGTLTVALVSNARMRSLNRTYRRRDYATDVLTFPAQPEDVGAPRGRRRSTAAFLGDIVIARGVAASQARRIGHSTAAELRVLALHGLLHLLGYDHEQDGGEMRRVEAQLRVQAGLEAGLIERAEPRGRRRAAGPRSGRRVVKK